MSDWDTVTVLRKKAPKSSQLKTESAVNQARRQGVAVDTQQKCKYKSGIQFYMHIIMRMGETKKKEAPGRDAIKAWATLLLFSMA